MTTSVHDEKLKLVIEDVKDDANWLLSHLNYSDSIDNIISVVSATIKNMNSSLNVLDEIEFASQRNTLKLKLAKKEAMQIIDEFIESSRDVYGQKTGIDIRLLRLQELLTEMWGDLK